MVAKQSMRKYNRWLRRDRFKRKWMVRLKLGIECSHCQRIMPPEWAQRAKHRFAYGFGDTFWPAYLCTQCADAPSILDPWGDGWDEDEWAEYRQEEL